MISWEAVILGSLTGALFFLAVALAGDWYRAVKYWTVVYRRYATDEERRAVRAVVHGVRVWLILYVAWTGW
jgi:hypothetical protein